MITLLIAVGIVFVVNFVAGLTLWLLWEKEKREIRRHQDAHLERRGDAD